MKTRTYLRTLGSMIITLFLYLAFACSKDEIIPSDIPIEQSSEDPIVNTQPSDTIAEDPAVDSTAIDSVAVDSACYCGLCHCGLCHCGKSHSNK